MSPKNALNTIDTMLHDLRSNSKPFGDVITLVTGDFFQTLSAAPKYTPADDLNFKMSRLCRFVYSIMLIVNNRFNLHQQVDDHCFVSKLLEIGNGSLPLDVNGLVDMNSIDDKFSSPEDLSTAFYPNPFINYVSHERMCERAILAPTSATVQAPNIYLLRQLPTQERGSALVDTITEPTLVTIYLTEVLISQEPSRL